MALEVNVNFGMCMEENWTILLDWVGKVSVVFDVPCNIFIGYVDANAEKRGFSTAFVVVS